MIIKVRKRLSDYPGVDANHRTYSRREFMERGIFTTTMAAALPHALVASMAKSAFGATTTTCPVAAAAAGGIAQIHGPGGGFNMAGYILNLEQMTMASAGSNAANLWGITGGNNLLQLGSNWGVDITHPFGQALMTPPPGITQAAWTAALKQTSWGYNFGTATADDGGGDNLGHIGSSSGMGIKKSVLSTDILVNNSVTLAPWASAMGSATQKLSTSPNNLTSASVAKGFGITPSTGTSGTLFNNTAAVGSALGNLFSSMMGGARAGASASLTAASCGFMGNSVMASSTFGTNLFTPANIPTIANFGVTIGTLSAQEQVLLAAYYQSNIGEIGGITLLNNGADYHGQSVQNTISPYDQNYALQVRMWLLAAMISNKASAMILSTNGSPGPTGTQNVTIPAISNSAGTTTVTVNGSACQGDNGGTFSGNGLLCYAPTGSAAPNLAYTGTINSDGSVKSSPQITTVPAAIASHYFTALTFLNGFNNNAFNLTQFQNVLAANGVATPVNLLTAANGS